MATSQDQADTEQAESSNREDKRPDRRVIYCLICKKPFEMLSTHLKRKCMKNSNQEERDQELKRAKESQKKWSSVGRTWEYEELLSLIKDRDACDAMANRLTEKYFLVLNAPAELAEDAQSRCEGKASSARAEQVLLLEAAKPWMQETCGRLNQGEKIRDSDLTHIRYYCMAILMVKHSRSGTAVTHFMVSKWNDRKLVMDGVFIQVEEEAGCVLSEEEEEWLKCYFTCVRPLSLKKQSGDTDDEGCFFLGNTGAPVANPSRDLERLLKHCEKLQSIGAASSLPSSEMLETQAGPSTAGSLVQERQQMAANSWYRFLQDFPISVHARPPNASDMASRGYGTERNFYFKWREEQKKEPVQYVLARCGRQPPTEAKVSSIVKKEDWGSNEPRFADVIKAWSLPVSVPVESDETIIASITQQRWKGVGMKDFGAPKGKGVIATMPFFKGDIICDYHGKLITEAEGKKLHEKQQGEMGYLFFFQNKEGVRCCIDAQTFPCECHPDKDTYGRRMNHSRKNPNVMPVLYKMNFPDGPRDTFLFKAIKDIPVNQELLWDYGVRRHSFGGEGLDCDWLAD